MRPTSAEICLVMWNDKPHDRTYSVLKFARKFVDLKVKHKCMTNYMSGVETIEYTFRDGSILCTWGRGSNHQVWVK